MSPFDVLTEANFALYAAKSYQKPVCADISEFQEDIGRIRSLSRLLQKYARTGELKERLVLNHIVVFYNMFEHRAATRMLAHRLYDHLKTLKPFLVLLGYWPEKIEPIAAKKNGIIGSDVPMDPRIVDALRRI